MNETLIQQILNKVKVPEKYETSFAKFVNLFHLPTPVKFFITDRISGKTTSKILDILAQIMLAIEKKQTPPEFIWLRRDWNDSVQKVMEDFKKVIRAFCNNFWQGKKTKKEDWTVEWKTIYRGVFYKGEQFIYFYDLYDDEASRGAHFGSPQEIIFDEFMPTHPSKYLSDKSINKSEEEGLTEEIMFSEMWSGGYRDELTKLCFLGNPYDRFNYAIQKNWAQELEEWAVKYQAKKPAIFALEKIKELPDGDELIYLEKIAESRKELSKFDSRDKEVWDKKFFAPLTSLNIIKLEENNYIPIEIYFNNIVLVRIKRQNQLVFAHIGSLKKENIPKNLPAIVFNNEEIIASSGKTAWLRKGKEITYRWAKQIKEGTLAYNDFPSRNKVLEFISQHNMPHKQYPWGIKK